MRRFYTQITEWRGGDKSQHWRPPSTSSPELLDLGRTQNAGPTESAPLRTTRVPEPERLGPGSSAQGRPLIVPGGTTYSPSSVGREATRAVSGGRPSVAEALRAHISVICLQHPAHPTHSAAEQVSLNKKKKKIVSSTVPFVSGREPDTEETSKQKKL